MTYAEEKEKTSEMAMQYQNSYTEGTAWSWLETATKEARLHFLTKRYGLIREFRENEVC